MPPWAKLVRTLDLEDVLDNLSPSILQEQHEEGNKCHDEGQKQQEETECHDEGDDLNSMELFHSWTHSLAWMRDFSVAMEM